MFKFNNKRLATLALLMFFSQSVLSSIVGYSSAISMGGAETQVTQHHSEISNQQHLEAVDATNIHSHAVIARQVEQVQKNKSSYSNHMQNMKDCCKGGSSCSMAGCVFIALPAMFDLKSGLQTYEIDISVYQSLPNSPVSSLYRPPITA
ncbi:MAG: hypothetical protein Q9M92_00225 [Enterobacterales bacterium]|nr:hypothetical protein [Enterobacterales bacterium]